MHVMSLCLFLPSSLVVVTIRKEKQEKTTTAEWKTVEGIESQAKTHKPSLPAFVCCLWEKDIFLLHSLLYPLSMHWHCHKEIRGIIDFSVRMCTCVSMHTCVS